MRAASLFSGIGAPEVAMPGKKPPSERRLAAQKANGKKAGDKLRKPAVWKTCECCGASFGLQPSMARANAGRFCSNECRYRTMRGPLGAASMPRPDMIGPLNKNWKGGIVEGRDVSWRTDSRIRVWRRAVFSRDAFECQMCGHDQGRTLCAHHCVPWAKSRELRFAVENGVTLCRPCHIFVHSARNVGCLFLAEPASGHRGAA